MGTWEFGKHGSGELRLPPPIMIAGHGRSKGQPGRDSKPADARAAACHAATKALGLPVHDELGLATLPAGRIRPHAV